MSMQNEVPMPSADAATLPSTWRDELDDLLRAIAGAFLFGAPLLYTMEVWWRGSEFSPGRMLLSLALTYAALLALNWAIGFRKQQTLDLGRAITDSVEALAIGLLTAAFSLFLLRRITPEMGLAILVGRVVVEAVPFSLGIALANGLLYQEDDPTEEETKDGSQPATDQGWRGTVADAGATVLGAGIISFSIAPTDEVPMIASALSGPWLLGLVAASLLLSYMIVFEAEFGSQATRNRHQGIFQSPLGETVFSYLLALLFSAGVLWFFGLLDRHDPWQQWVIYSLVLGLPATIGGAAGRLAV